MENVLNREDVEKRQKGEGRAFHKKIDLFDEKKFCNASKGSREFSQA